jgi:glycosyltransferase involved in cell wall biosynthesis
MPHRVLLATHANAHFIEPIREHLRADHRFEVRSVDLAGTPELKGLNSTRLAAAALGDTDFSLVVERLLRPHLDWANTVWVDWCAAFAVLVTLIDPGSSRIIVRLHSYETFSWWPHLVDFTRVDDVVFVSDHLRDVACEAVPGLGEGPSRKHVVPIGIDTGRFASEKDQDARFTLGLVGYSQIAKDPIWALEVLRAVRHRDDRYWLLLVGANLNTRASAAGRQYLNRFEALAAELIADGAVEQVGQTDDVPGVLRRVGVILSTSVRESFHLGLIEGAASEAVPVVRNWPLFAHRTHGAHTLFPSEWLVETPQAAAERILATTRTEDEWRRHGAEAARYVRSRWDTTVVAPLLDELLGVDRSVDPGRQSLVEREGMGT